MTRKRSTSLFVVFAIILVLLLVATFVNFTYPLSVNGKYYSYSSFVSNIKLGNDIGENLRIVYRTDLPYGESEDNYNVLLKSTKSELKDIVNDIGYNDVSVASYGERGILLTVGNILSESDSAEIINLIGDPETLSFYMEEKTDSSVPIAVAHDIKDVTAHEYYDSTTGEMIYYVQINFKDSSKSKIANATKDGGTLYYYFGDTQFTSMSLSESITDGIITMQSDVFTDLNTATYYANKIKTGTLALELTKIESANITPDYGVGANILLAIAMAIVVLAFFIYLIIRYKHLGWLACFNLLFFITISIFLIQSIPLVTINFSGIIAMMIALIVAIDSLMMIFEKAKSYYNADTKLYVALRVAQKDNLSKILFTSALLVVAGLISIFLPVATLQSFGWVMMIGGLLNMFTSLVLMRLFIKMYLPYNNNDGKKCNFHKGGQNA